MHFRHDMKIKKMPFGHQTKMCFVTASISKILVIFVLAGCSIGVGDAAGAL
jgi:hypothetical protein